MVNRITKPLLKDRKKVNKILATGTALEVVKILEEDYASMYAVGKERVMDDESELIISTRTKEDKELEVEMAKLWKIADEFNEIRFLLYGKVERQRKIGKAIECYLIARDFAREAEKNNNQDLKEYALEIVELEKIALLKSLELKEQDITDELLVREYTKEMADQKSYINAIDNWSRRHREKGLGILVPYDIKELMVDMEKTEMLINPKFTRYYYIEAVKKYGEQNETTKEIKEKAILPAFNEVKVLPDRVETYKNRLEKKTLI